MPPGVFLLGPGPLGSKAGSGDGRGRPAESGMGPPAGMVRARPPANPLFSVFGREPRAGNFGIGGPPAGMVRGLLPANREPLQLRFGEQILHTNSAPQVETGRLFQGTVCSPFPANPCGSVSGSKIFTLFPRRRPGPAAFSEARFAPR